MPVIVRVADASCGSTNSRGGCQSTPTDEGVDSMLQKYPAMQIMALATDGNSFVLFSASDGIRSMIYKEPEAEILDVIRSNSRMRESE
jgi:hypothetical protein